MKRLVLWACLVAALWFPASRAASAEGEGKIVWEKDALAAGMERSWAQGWEPLVQGDALVILLPVSAPEGTGRVTATLEMSESAVTPFREQSMAVTAVRDETGLWPVRFKLRLLSDYRSGDYPCTVRLEGEGCRGEAELLLRLRGGLPPEGDGRPALSGVEGRLVPGEEAILSATIADPWPNRALTDIVFTVTDPTGEILPAGTDLHTAPDLLPGESAALRVPLTVLPGAGVTVHALRFDLTCTVLGESRSFAQTFYLPVTEEIRLEQGGIQGAASALQGEAAALTLPLMNLGRTELRNVCASLSLPGVVERQSVLVGNIPAGESRPAKWSCLVPSAAAPGEYTGAVSVTAEDQWGNTAALELPVSLTVEERPAPAEKEVPRAQAAGAVQRIVWGLAGLCAALAVALGIQGAVLRARIRRLEEARL